MAKTTKKKPLTPQGGNILSFFAKPQGPTSATGRKSSSSAQDVNGGAVKVEPIEVDRKGKGRAICGTEDDPVVISDDEDVRCGSARKAPTGIKEDANASSAGPSTPPARVSRDPPPVPRPKRSCSPTQAPPIDPPPPFRGYPDFKPPPSWPQIVNTADTDNLAHDVELEVPDAGSASRSENRGSTSPSDSSADDDDARVIGDDDDDSVFGRDDAEHTERDPTDGYQDSGLDMALDMEIDGEGGVADEMEEVMEIAPPSPVPVRRISSNNRIGSAGDGGMDLDMQWDEGDDEGMGMEEEDEGDDEASVRSFPVVGKRGREKGVDKANECPVCGKSLKGKVNTVVSAHINSCLDTTPSQHTSRRRPISSFALGPNSASPAPTTPSPPPEEPTKGPNAFSVLMSGHKEKEQWRDAEVDLKRDGKRVFGRRNAPFYKVLEGMPVAVDAFRYGAIPKVTAYLLTHAHSDHYTNLSKSWNHGPIYCSETTANLVIHMLGVEPQWVHGLPDNVPYEMPNTGGVTVIPIEANHCPGSSIFLFEGRHTVHAGDSIKRSPYIGSKRVFRYLHCGDFRACPRHVLHPAVARARIDTCYLDTTYLNPRYCFPPQPQVIDACASLARKVCVGVSESAPPIPEHKPIIKLERREGEDEDEVDLKPDLAAQAVLSEEKAKAMMAGWLVKREDGVKVEVGEDGMVVKTEEGETLREIKPKLRKARTLVVMGTYSIGKERIIRAVAKALGTTIYCDPRKKGILLCQTDPELHSLLSNDPFESQVHLLPLGNIQLDRLQPYLARLHPHFDRVLGFRPTGWAYTPPAGTDMMPDVNLVIRRDQGRYFSEVGLKPMRGSCRDFMMYGVPYSEHSSFFELTCFALSMPGPSLRMIATVNVGNEKSRAKMQKWFDKWLAEKAKRREKGLPAVVDYRDVSYW